MECPYCGAELVVTDYYGYGIPGSKSFEKIGDILECPNGVNKNKVCASEVFHCAGCFYTDRNGELHEGYPC